MAAIYELTPGFKTNFPGAEPNPAGISKTGQIAAVCRERVLVGDKLGNPCVNGLLEVSQLSNNGQITFEITGYKKPTFKSCRECVIFQLTKPTDNHIDLSPSLKQYIDEWT